MFVFGFSSVLLLDSQSHGEILQQNNLDQRKLYNAYSQNKSLLTVLSHFCLSSAINILCDNDMQILQYSKIIEMP